jgi:general secretion pathway protein B
MSLILEALRKSEAERRRGEMPDLRAELPPPSATKRAPMRKALPWIAALAAIAIAAVLLSNRWPRDAATTPVPAETATMPVESVRMRPQPPFAPRETARVETARVETAHGAGREAPEPQPAPRAATPVATTQPGTTIRGQAPQPPPAPAPANDAETTVNALSADLRKALPPLQLSMHMWDPDPAKRFVILDGERHVEGDSVGPMRIRRIDADGVLFDWQGRAVRLPLR